MEKKKKLSFSAGKCEWIWNNEIWDESFCSFQPKFVVLFFFQKDFCDCGIYWQIKEKNCSNLDFAIKSETYFSQSLINFKDFSALKM